jgi:hypothetical protein
MLLRLKRIFINSKNYKRLYFKYLNKFLRRRFYLWKGFWLLRRFFGFRWRLVFRLLVLGTKINDKFKYTHYRGHYIPKFKKKFKAENNLKIRKHPKYKQLLMILKCIKNEPINYSKKPGPYKIMRSQLKLISNSRYKIII